MENSIAAARLKLLSTLGNHDAARRAQVELAWALLHGQSIEPNSINEIELLLSFADDPNAARGNIEPWPQIAKTALGYLYRELGRLEDARQAFQQAYDWQPEDPRIVQVLTTLLEQMGKLDEAHEIKCEHETLKQFRIEDLPTWQPLTRERTTTDLFLSLLEKTICNSIYGDASHPSAGATQFNPGRRAVGRDLPTVAHTMVGLRRLHHFRWAIETVISAGIVGDILEAGVWRGGACILARGVLAAHGCNDRRVFVADSFNGLPAPDERFNKDLATLFDFDWRPELAVSLEEVKKNFDAYDLLDDQVVFIPGYFKDTLQTVPISSLSILRLDCDLYSSTIDTLEALYDKVAPGGFIICDDYGVVIDARRAVLDFRRRRGIEAQMSAIDGDGVFWRK